MNYQKIREELEETQAGWMRRGALSSEGYLAIIANALNAMAIMQATEGERRANRNPDKKREPIDATEFIIPAIDKAMALVCDTIGLPGSEDLIDYTAASIVNITRDYTDSIATAYKKVSGKLG